MRHFVERIFFAITGHFKDKHFLRKTKIFFFDLTHLFNNKMN